jgi:hypothetical protein
MAKAKSKAAPAVEPLFIKKNKMAIVVEVSTYKDETAVDIREYYPDRATGEFKPSGKGCRIPLNRIGKVITRLREIKADLKEESA